MKKVFKQILTWFEGTFHDDRTEDWYHKQIVDSVVARYTTKAELKEELSDIINSLQQEQPEVDLEKEIKEYLEKLGGGHGGFVDDLTDDDLTGFAHHFYELGRLNARKED